MPDKRELLFPGILLAAAGFALVFYFGRGIEARRDAAWRDTAARLQGTFRSGPSCSGLERFGTPTPWAQWSSDGELQCLRVIEGSDAAGPWALVQVRYSVRERRGEEHPDTWHEVTVAALRRPTAAAAPDGYVAMQNGQSLFLWKKSKVGAGASLDAEELPALLEQARRVAAR